jgi:hypothetical protein
MTQKDQISASKIAQKCAEDYSKLKNSGVDASGMPPRQWIRAWMQTKYNIIKLSGYFYREFTKALTTKSSLNEENMSLGLAKKARQKAEGKDAISSLSMFDDVDLAFEYLKNKIEGFDVMFKSERIDNMDKRGNVYWRFNLRLPTLDGIDDSMFFVYSQDLDHQQRVDPYAGVFSYNKKFQDFMKRNYPEYILQRHTSGSTVFVNPDQSNIEMIPADLLDITADWITTQLKNMNESDLGLAKKTRQQAQSKDAVDNISFLSSPYDVAQALMNYIKSISNDPAIKYEIEALAKRKNHSSYYVRISKEGIDSLNPLKFEFLIQDDYKLDSKKRTSSNEKGTTITMFPTVGTTNSWKFCKMLGEEIDSSYVSNKEALSLLDPSKPKWNGSFVFANDNGEYEFPVTLLKKIASVTCKFLAELSEFVENFRSVKESSLGLAKKTRAQSQEKDAIEQVTVSKKELLLRKIIVMLKRAGFKKCQDPYMFDDNPWPKRPMEFTVFEWEKFYSTIGIDFKSIKIYLESHVDVFGDTVNSCVCIDLNPEISRDEDSGLANRASIGITQYDRISWIGQRQIGSLIPTPIGSDGIAKIISPSNSKWRYLKNSKSPDIGNVTSIDFNGDYEFKCLLEDLRGIIETVAAFNEDVKKGYDINANFKETEDMTIAEQVWAKVMTYARKNTRALPQATNESLANRVRDNFKGKTAEERQERALDEISAFHCKKDNGEFVDVARSKNPIANSIFEWLVKYVPTLMIKDDEKKKTPCCVDDYITLKWAGYYSICMYHHEYSSFGPPTYISYLEEYFNGNEMYPLILSAHNVGNYSIAVVQVRMQGKKYRLCTEAYYQDRSMSTRRSPNGKWRTAKRSVLPKDCPALEHLHCYRRRVTPEGSVV